MLQFYINTFNIRRHIKRTKNVTALSTLSNRGKNNKILREEVNFTIFIFKECLVIIPAGLSLSKIGNSWPLIRFLIDDPVYKNIYHYEMKNAMNAFTGFAIDKCKRLFTFHINKP